MANNLIQKYELNNQPVWRGILSKRHGKPVHRPTDYVIRLLVPNDADAMGALSEKIYQNLKQEEACFIHKHEKSYYAQSFRKMDLYYVGVFADGKLVGMSYLQVCKSNQEFAAEIPGSPMGAIPVSQEKPVAAFGADSILPDYRGNHLNQIMVEFRLCLAKQLGCAYATSIIDRKNHWNMAPYFSNGFHMYAAAIDPADNGKIALMAFHMDRFKTREEYIGIRLPYDRMRLIDTALKNGFTGVEYNAQTREILFESPHRHVKKIIQNSALYRSIYQRLQEREYVHV